MIVCMEKFFNTAGPVDCQRHYCLPPLERFDLEDVLFLIEQQKYFVLHAPRQTGKTSCLLALRDYLNAGGRYACVYVNIESAQAARENVAGAMRAMLSNLEREISATLNDQSLKDRWMTILENSGEFQAFHAVLAEWAAQSSKPIVLLLDEVDALIGDTLIALLRQLRAGYANRPQAFPQSIILCGVRDVRDYRIHSGSEKAVITGGSAFNVKAESLRLGDFSRRETERFYRYHTTETGQEFTSEALDVIWALTEGQPWLVNALGYEVTFRVKTLRDRSITITADMIEQAKENIVQRRETHLDQLADKLKEARVHNVIAPILQGAERSENFSEDDISYAYDLGLIKTRPSLRIANRIYREVIPRELTYGTQVSITHETQWYVDEEGRLNMPKLLTAFQDFFRKNIEHWIERFQYKEAGPQLLLQAFLQRILNGGGRIDREYGLGRNRTDLLVVWPYDDGVQETVIEMKILYGALDTTIRDGLKQTWKYMDACGTHEGHLLIFDRHPGRAWEDKIFCRRETYNNTSIAVWGM